jgi:hypothetical protein
MTMGGMAGITKVSGYPCIQNLNDSQQNDRKRPND